MGIDPAMRAERNISVAQYCQMVNYLSGKRAFGGELNYDQFAQVCIQVQRAL